MPLAVSGDGDGRSDGRDGDGGGRTVLVEDNRLPEAERIRQGAEAEHKRQVVVERGGDGGEDLSHGSMRARGKGGKDQKIKI